MKDVLKFLSFWIVCMAIATFTLIEVSPYHRINVAGAVLITVAAPIFALIGTGKYIIQLLEVNWNKCIVGCENG